VQKENEVVKKEIMDLYREQQEYNSRMEDVFRRSGNWSRPSPRVRRQKNRTGAGPMKCRPATRCTLFQSKPAWTWHLEATQRFRVISFT
jgi:hypothetical protein